MMGAQFASALMAVLFRVGEHVLHHYTIRTFASSSTQHIHAGDSSPA